MLRACSQVTVCFTSASFAISVCQTLLRKRSKEMEVTRRRDGPVASVVNNVPTVARRKQLQVRLADKGLALAQQPRPFASNGLPCLKRTTVILSSYSGKTTNEIHNKRSLMVPEDSFHNCNRGLMLTDGVPSICGEVVGFPTSG
jgi:hypothetical protein